MKQTLITLLIAFALIFSGVGLVEAQQPMEECELVRPLEFEDIDANAEQSVGPEGSGADVTGEAWAIVCMINTVNRAAQVLFFIMMGLVVGLVIVGGFFILTGGGNEENIAKGKKFITYAIVGVFIGVFAYAVPAILNFIM